MSTHNLTQSTTRSKRSNWTAWLNIPVQVFDLLKEWCFTSYRQYFSGFQYRFSIWKLRISEMIHSSLLPSVIFLFIIICNLWIFFRIYLPSRNSFLFNSFLNQKISYCLMNPRTYVIFKFVVILKLEQRLENHVRYDSFHDIIENLFSNVRSMGKTLRRHRKWQLN